MTGWFASAASSVPPKRTWCRSRSTRRPQSLKSPSSAARALVAGAPNIERVDRLVQSIGAQHGMHNASVDETVKRVDAWLVRNRRKG